MFYKRILLLILTITYLNVQAGVKDKEIKKIRTFNGITQNITGQQPLFNHTGLEINSSIQTFIDGEIERQENYMRENYDEWKCPCTLHFSYEIIQMNKRYLSFYIVCDIFSGGPYSNFLIKCFNYDLKQKKNIILSDLIKTPDVPIKLSVLCRENLLQDTTRGFTLDDEWFLEGTEAVLKNFELFTFNKKEIHIHFAQSQIGPRVIGHPRATIQKENLSKRLALIDKK